MFWNTNEVPVMTALARFRNKYALNAEAAAVLDELIDWLGEQQRHRKALSQDALLQVLLGSEQFDKDALSKEIKFELESFEMTSTMLVDKLAALHATLTDRQRQLIADDFEKHEITQKQWHGWSGTHRSPHKAAA